jgi:transposase
MRELEAAVPPDHLLRRLDRLLDLGELRRALTPHYGSRGRPSIPPKLLIRMALLGRLYGIGSERRLCEEVRYNLAYRWFCRLPLDARVPHHSTFSKNRHGRFRDAGVFRLLFEQTVRLCMAAGLVGSKDAAIDASFVAADASWQRKMRDDDLDAPRLARPVREWLADQAVSAAALEPAALSRTDPASAWAKRPSHGRFGYAFNILVDMPSGVTLDVEASPARFAAEVDAGRVMLERAVERFGYRPKRVLADTAYGSAAFLAFVHERGTMPHIPVLERSGQTRGKFTRAAFRYEAEQDRYICPTGKALEFHGTDARSGVLQYAARPVDCLACGLKPDCTKAQRRTIVRSEHEEVRDLVRAEMQTGLFKRSMKLRRGVERLFAEAKTRRGLGRLRLRGLRGAQEEFLLGAAVANLVRLVRPADRPVRRRREPPPPLRPGHMAHVGDGPVAQVREEVQVRA